MRDEASRAPVTPDTLFAIGSATKAFTATALALLAILGAAPAASASSARPEQDDGLRALDGEWIYVEDRTEGRASEEQQPSMSARVTLRVEEDAVVLIPLPGLDQRCDLGLDVGMCGDNAFRPARGPAGEEDHGPTIRIDPG